MAIINMNLTKKIWMAVLLAAFAGPALAQPKIGIIDMTKVFDNFYKTKAANESMKEFVRELDKQQQDLMDELKRSNEDYKKAMDDANNQAVSADERDKAKKVAEAKFKEVQEKQQQLEGFNRGADARIREKRRQIFERILEEIRTVVTSQAKEKSFTLVLDSNAESVRGTPMVLYNNGDNDLTATVLTQLNNTSTTALEEKKK